LACKLPLSIGIACSWPIPPSACVIVIVRENILEAAGWDVYCREHLLSAVTGARGFRRVKTLPAIAV
jgi:hypothetical protein